MSQRPTVAGDERIDRAIAELIALIRRRHPSASFEVERAEDEPELVHLLARVDVEDTEDVADLVMDRMIEMQVAEGLPIYAIPSRTSERIAARRAALRDRSAGELHASGS